MTRSDGRKLYPQSGVSCITITVVGEISESANDGAAQISALMGRIEQAISEVFPSFYPGHPPVTITIVSLPELRVAPPVVHMPEGVDPKQVASAVVQEIGRKVKQRQ